MFQGIPSGGNSVITTEFLELPEDQEKELRGRYDVTADSAAVSVTPPATVGGGPEKPASVGVVGLAR